MSSGGACWAEWECRSCCRAQPGRPGRRFCRTPWAPYGVDCSWASGSPGCSQGRSRCLLWREEHPKRQVVLPWPSGPWLYCWRWAYVRPTATRRPGSRYRRRSKLGILRSIESRLERVVEGSVGRLFRASVAPVELARKLAKELEEGKVVSVTQTYAPNEYTIYLSPRDRTRFADFEASLRNELASYLAEHARRAGYVMPTRPRVRFETESTLHTGIFGISTALVRDDDAPIEPLEAPPASDVAAEPAARAAAWRPRRPLRPTWICPCARRSIRIRRMPGRPASRCTRSSQTPSPLEPDARARGRSGTRAGRGAGSGAGAPVGVGVLLLPAPAGRTPARPRRAAARGRADAAAAARAAGAAPGPARDGAAPGCAGDPVQRPRRAAFRPRRPAAPARRGAGGAAVRVARLRPAGRAAARGDHDHAAGVARGARDRA